MIFVFGTMVEFACVLMAQQRTDWNKKEKKKENRLFMTANTKIDNDTQLDEANTDTIVGNNYDYLDIINILNPCQLTMDMPSYRKVDALSFVLFICLYVTFNFVYFLICIKY